MVIFLIKLLFYLFSSQRLENIASEMYAVNYLYIPENFRLWYDFHESES